MAEGDTNLEKILAHDSVTRTVAIGRQAVLKCPAKPHRVTPRLYS